MSADGFEQSFAMKRRCVSCGELLVRPGRFCGETGCLYDEPFWTEPDPTPPGQEPTG